MQDTFTLLTDISPETIEKDAIELFALSQTNVDPKGPRIIRTKRRITIYKHATLNKLVIRWWVMYVDSWVMGFRKWIKKRS